MRNPILTRHVLSAIGIATLVIATSAQAADATEAGRIAELEKKLERSLRLIEDLSSKLDKLEQASAAPRETGNPQQAAKVEELEKQVGQLTAGMGTRSEDTGLPVHGFGDVGFARSAEDHINQASGKRIEGAKGFTVGSFDLYLTPQFGDRVKALVELNFEVNREGSVGTDLERLQIGYTFNDALTAWVGRFHTPYGYWNTAFHHGSQIQTSISRPLFLDFEDAGGILPAHTTGAWLTGSVPVAGDKVSYDLYAGNAPRIQDVTAGLAAGRYGDGALDMKMAGNTSYTSSLGFNLGYSPSRIDGLKVGIHGLRARVGADDTNGALLDTTRMQTLGAYGAYSGERLELLAEYYHFWNKDLTGSTGTRDSSAWYAQAGYNIGAWTPYGRLEKTDLDQKDNYFLHQASGRSYKKAVLGLRYDVDAKSAVKIELATTRKSDIGIPGTNIDDQFGEVRAQYAIRF